MSDVFPKVLKLSSGVSECKPLAGGGAGGATGAGEGEPPAVGRRHERPHGRAVQLDTINPTLKAPGTNHFETKI